MCTIKNEKEANTFVYKSIGLVETKQRKKKLFRVIFAFIIIDVCNVSTLLYVFVCGVVWLNAIATFQI